MLQVGIVGAGRRGRLRAEAVSRVPGVRLAGVADREPERAAALAAHAGTEAFSSVDALLERTEVLLVSVPTSDHFQIARAAARAGVHAFLEWPPAVSVRECLALARLVEEAGIEVGVSRPLRFHPALGLLPPGWRAELVVLRLDGADPHDRPWPHLLADAADLCIRLAGGAGIQRLDAERVREPAALALNLRFHSGTYAQVNLRPRAPAAERRLFAAGPDLHLEADLAGGRALVHRRAENAAAGDAFREVSVPAAAPLRTELAAFLDAVCERRGAPVSILDGLNTMRLLERLMARLR